MNHEESEISYAWYEFMIYLCSFWVELREKWKLDQRNKKESKMGEVESS